MRKARRDVKLAFSDNEKDENAVQTHLKKEERGIIEESRPEGGSNKNSGGAWAVGKHDRTGIEGDLRQRFSELRNRAQKLADKCRKALKMSKTNEKTWEKVLELFKKDFSPEQIASVVRVSHESNYRRIYAEIRAERLDRHSRELFEKSFP